MPKPFFYRINAADFFAITRELSNKDLAKWTRSFAADLVAGNSNVEFTSKMIEEAKLFAKKKSLAGQEGMKNRYHKS